MSGLPAVVLCEVEVFMASVVEFTLRQRKVTHLYVPFPWQLNTPVTAFQ